MDRGKCLNEMEFLLEKKVSKETNKGIITVGFTRKGNKHLYNDILGRAKVLQIEDLINLHVSLENSTFIDSVKLVQKRKDDITKFYYFKDNDKDLYYNVAEVVNKGKVHRYLYSITNILTHIVNKQNLNEKTTSNHLGS